MRGEESVRTGSKNITVKRDDGVLLDEKVRDRKLVLVREDRK